MHNLDKITSKCILTDTAVIREPLPARTTNPKHLIKQGNSLPFSFKLLIHCHSYRNRSLVFVNFHTVDLLHIRTHP